MKSNLTLGGASEPGVAAKYGLFLADKGITARATVIVDKAGKVAWVQQQEIPQARANAQILEQLAKLK